MARIKKYKFKPLRMDLDEEANSEFNFGSDEEEVANTAAAAANKLSPADAQQQNVLKNANGALLQSAVKRQRDARSWEKQGQRKKYRLESKVQGSTHNNLRISDGSEIKPCGSWLEKLDNLQHLNEMRSPSPVSRLAANVIGKRGDLTREYGVKLNGMLSSPSFKPRGNERPKLIVMRGDPTDWSTAAIVSDTNSLLHHNSGLAATIARKGGLEIQRHSSEWVYHYGEVPIGSAMWTTAGKLSSKFIIYTVGPDVSLYRWPTPRHHLELRQAIRSALHMADNLGVTSVAMPALCTGVCGYPKYLAAREIVTECLEFCDNCPSTSLRLIALMNEDEVTTSIFVQAMKDARQQRQLELQRRNVAAMRESAQTSGDLPVLDGGSDSSSAVSEVEESAEEAAVARSPKLMSDWAV
ncbi:hypothetical protein JG688_00012908 [Phytophthora aleatoria]|uniref:Macro domain-containing protein n=1 Tax=Phytophthora aleatoria TaxID=2496075 RepID=A0A8J5IN74_9STRA|nr:hypothetical protein JG688_00012908 [Phytophthora aleatoria]